MTTPKQVSDFAKEYQEMYIELAQLRSAYDILFKERDHWKRAFDIEHDAFMKYQQQTMKKLESLGAIMSKHGLGNN